MILRHQWWGSTLGEETNREEAACFVGKEVKTSNDFLEVMHAACELLDDPQGSSNFIRVSRDDGVVMGYLRWRGSELSYESSWRSI